MFRALSRWTTRMLGNAQKDGIVRSEKLLENLRQEQEMAKTIRKEDIEYYNMNGVSKALKEAEEKSGPLGQ